MPGATAQEASQPPLLVTYGPQAGTREGDPDYRQVIYLSVPNNVKDRLFLRVFDPDAVGDHDLIYGRPNTLTRFTLFGGAGAFVGPTEGSVIEPIVPAKGGTQIGSEEFADDETTDGQWQTLFAVDPRRGDPVGDRIVFRLDVEGMEGNDGNIYDVTLSLRDRRNLLPDGLRIFSFQPTVRVLDSKTLTEIRYQTPKEGGTLVVGNFDAAHGRLHVTSRFESKKLIQSGQDNWRATTLPISPGERGAKGAVTAAGGREMPNDITLLLSDQENRLLPFDLPPRSFVPNRRPRIAVENTVLSTCRAISFDARGTRDPDGDELDYLWRFADKTTAKGPVIVKTFDTVGEKFVRLEVTDSSGQVGNGSAREWVVLLKAPPRAKIEAPQVVAASYPVVLDGSQSTSGDYKIDRYTWSINDGTEATGARLTHRFKEPGSYLVTLQVRDNSGHVCDTAKTTISVRANDAPVANAGNDRRISPMEELSFDGSDSFDRDGKIIAYRWDFGDGNTAESAQTQHRYQKPGRYSVKLTIEDDAGVENSITSDTATVIVNARPRAVIGENLRVAIDQKIAFDGGRSSDADGRIIAYDWDFGDGNTVAGARVDHAFSRPGRYVVHLAVTDDSKTSTNSDRTRISVIVNAPPVAVAGPDRVISNKVRFDGSGSSDPDGRIAQYRWDFGDGQTGSGKSPVHVYRQTGTYPVKLTVADDSGTERNTANDQLTVVVNAPPIADAGPDHVAAPNEELIFQADRSIDPDGDIVSYDWDFGDGTSAKGRRQAHSYRKSGTYLARLAIADDTGLEDAIDYDEVLVTINWPPVARAGSDVKAAPGEQVTLDGYWSSDRDGKIASYRWDFSDSDEALQGQKVIRTFAEPGVYTATLTVTDDSNTTNGTHSDSLTIRVNHQPVAAAGADIHTASRYVTFDAGGSADADGDPLIYMWDFGDGQTATGVRVGHLYRLGGTYPVILSVNDGKGLANSIHQDGLRVRINRPPVANAGGNRDVCTGDIVVFDGSGSKDPEEGVLRYVWDFGDGSGSDIVNPTKTFRKPATYPVTLEVRDESGLNNDRHTDRALITVNPAPIAQAGKDILACANAEVQFDGSKSWDIDGVVNRFQWDFGDGGAGAGDRPTHIYRRPGTYRTILTIEGDPGGQCDHTATDELKVTVVEAPAVRIQAPSRAAVGSTIAFDGSQSALQGGEIKAWHWEFGDGGKAEGAKAKHRFEKPGTYRVRLAVDSTAKSAECRTVDKMHLLVVNAAPTAVAGKDRTVSVGQEVAFDGSGSSDPDGGLTAFAWDFGDGSTGTGMAARHTFRKPSTYRVALTVTDDAGVENSAAQDDIQITVLPALRPRLSGPDKTCPGDKAEWMVAGLPAVANVKTVTSNWVMGDGNRKTGEKVSHSYEKPGRYPLTVVTDAGTGHAKGRGYATKVIAVNAAPVARAGPDRLVCPGVAVDFDASGSWDSDGTIRTYRWDFGDGGTAAGRTANHIFNKPGRYTVRLDVEDGSGTGCSTGSDTLEVTVNGTPFADAGPDREAFTSGANAAVMLNGWRSFDPDGGALTFDWQIGADDRVEGERVRYLFKEAGETEVTLTVSDMTGLPCGIASDKMTVTVRDR